MYSRPSSALARICSRVSVPERGAYSTPASAPKPSPARNHTMLLPSRSDIVILLAKNAYHGWYILHPVNSITGDYVGERFLIPSAHRTRTGITESNWECADYF